MDAALGEGTDAASLALVSAQKGVKVKGESDKPGGNVKKETLGEGWRHADSQRCAKRAPADKLTGRAAD